jgi:acetolactate synthase I/II/III large subunit
MTDNQRVADLLIRCLEQHGVEIVFGIPGAKIDAVFDALVQSSIRLVVCRHEQNAAFMAGAYGRLTSKPGVVIVTSGPGVGNLATGLLTATTEGDPIVAIGGNVPQNMLHKEAHQNTNNVKLMEAVTKKSVEVSAGENVPEAIANAFRIANQRRRGACFISIPQDIGLDTTTLNAPIQAIPIEFGTAKEETLDKAAKIMESAKTPILLLGEESTQPQNTEAIRCLMRNHQIPVVSTYQASGVVPKDLIHLFYGRIGLFKNQPADILLEASDCVMTIGFNPIEYDPEVWNTQCDKEIIHIDYQPCDIHLRYQPDCEILGDIALNVDALNTKIKKIFSQTNKYSELREELHHIIEQGKTKVGKNGLIHPLRFIHELSKIIDENTIVACDIGSVYMWIARYLISHIPHQLLFSNGQQTLGVALPWAIATKMSYPQHNVLSISGDGGFLFSAMELETAVREKIKFIHFIWSDGHYNMVQEQQIMKYHRDSGVKLGCLDIPSFAKGFGAVGYNLTDPDSFTEIYQKALGQDVPVLINVAIDYSDNPALFETIHPHQCN